MSQPPRTITITLTQEEEIKLRVWLGRAIGASGKSMSMPNDIRKFIQKLDDINLTMTLDDNE
jgi:hypothetical protein